MATQNAKLDQGGWLCNTSFSSSPQGLWVRILQEFCGEPQMSRTLISQLLVAVLVGGAPGRQQSSNVRFQMFSGICWDEIGVCLEYNKYGVCTVSAPHSPKPSRCPTARRLCFASEVLGRCLCSQPPPMSSRNTSKTLQGAVPAFMI